MYRCFSIGTNFQKPFTVLKFKDQKFTISNYTRRVLKQLKVPSSLKKQVQFIRSCAEIHFFKEKSSQVKSS